MKLLIQNFDNGYVISTHAIWWMQLLIHDGVKLIHVSERCPKEKIKRIVVIHYLPGHMRKSSITNYFAQLIRQYPFPSCCEVKGMFIVASTNDMQWYMYGLYHIMYFMVQHSWNGVYTWSKVNTGCVFVLLTWYSYKVFTDSCHEHSILSKDINNDTEGGLQIVFIALICKTFPVLFSTQSVITKE